MPESGDPRDRSGAADLPRDSGPGGPDLPAGDLERVIRRAAEIQLDAGEGGREILTEDEVLRIGREVGIEPRHVRRALAEVRAESLVPELPDRTGMASALWGEAVVRSSRVVPGDAEEVQRKVEEHFRGEESLQSVRRRSGRSLWEPAGGLVSKMQRALDVGGKGYELAEARSVELAVVDLEPGWSLVTLTVDLANLRRDQAIAWTAGATPVLLAGGVMASLALGFPMALALVGAGGGVAAASTLGAGWTLEKKRRRYRLVVEGLLDRLEQNESLRPRRSGWREQLLGERQ